MIVLTLDYSIVFKVFAFGAIDKELESVPLERWRNGKRSGVAHKDFGRNMLVNQVTELNMANTVINTLRLNQMPNSLILRVLVLLPR